MAVLSKRGLSSCTAQQRGRVVATMERTIRNMNVLERNRLLALLMAQIEEDACQSNYTTASDDELLAESLDLVARVIGESPDHADIRLRVDYGRIHLAWDWDARNSGCPTVNLIMVCCGRARATLAHARLHGTLHHTGETDVCLTPDEWKWLTGSRVNHVIRDWTEPC